MQRFHPGICNMSINLGRREVGVAEQKLNHTQVRAVIEQMGCERVA